MANTILDKLKRIVAPFFHPVLVYDADPPAISDGDMRPAQMGPNGGLLVETAGVAGSGAALDSTLTDGTQVSNPSPATPSSSSAYEVGRVLKASAGTFRSLYVQLDPSLAPGIYYVQLLTNSATLPSDGAVTHLRPPQTIVHVAGVAEGANFDEGDAGIAFSVGCSACVSSTQFTKTGVADAALFAGSVL